MQISLSKGASDEVTVKVSESDDLNANLLDSHSFPFENVKDHDKVAVEVFNNKDKPVGHLLRRYGRKLFIALFEEGTLARKLLQQTLPPQSDGPILLDLNGDDKLDDIPWENAWADNEYLVRLCMFTRIHKRLGPRLPALPLRIVVVAPVPIDSHTLGMADLHPRDQYQNFIDENHRRSKNVILERVHPATVETMDWLLADKRDDSATVLHFMGHCVESKNGSRALVFEHRDTGKSEYVSTPRLISDPKNLRLAFLSACNTRELARTMVQQGVQYTIGSFCDLPDDIARKFEAYFYHCLSQGQSVDKAMFRSRLELSDIDDYRQRDYVPGSMILYSTTSRASDGLFLCSKADFQMPHNLDVKIPTTSIFCGRKKELDELNTILRRMAIRANQTRDVCTITGISGQGKTMLAKKAAKQIQPCFPGGIFAWQFRDDVPISATRYLWELVRVLLPHEMNNIFPSGPLPNILGCPDVNEHGWTIFKKLKATSLLILDHADALKYAQHADHPDEDAVSLWKLLHDVSSNEEIPIKILATSHESLGWPREEVVPLDSFLSDIESGIEVFIQNLDNATEGRMKNELEENMKRIVDEATMIEEEAARMEDTAKKLEEAAEGLRDNVKEMNDGIKLRNDEIKRMNDEIKRMQEEATNFEESAKWMEEEAKNTKRMAEELKGAKRETKENPDWLLQRLVTLADGHPLCLKLLAEAASLLSNRETSLKAIVGDYNQTMLKDDHSLKILANGFRPMVTALPMQQHSLLCACSLFNKPVEIKDIHEISQFFDYEAFDDIDRDLQQLCHRGLLVKDGNQYRSHTAVCKVAKHFIPMDKLQTKRVNGQTLLHWAAMRGHNEVVRLLVAEFRIDTNAKDKDGQTPLHKAAWTGHVEIVRLLGATFKADANAKNNWGGTPLHSGAERGRIEVVRSLVAEFGADVNVIQSDGRTPLHLAAGRGWVDVVRLLVAECGADANARSNDGLMPLHLAAKGGHVEVVKLFLTEFGADANLKHRDGWTPLHWAAEVGRVEVVRLLVGEFGADANAMSNTRMTPLHYAAGRGHVEIVSLLVTQFGADANAKDKDGQTPLHGAAWTGHSEVVRLFVETFRADVDIKNNWGGTPLDEAARAGNVEVVRLLVAEFRADANTRDNFGRTPLHSAAKYGHIEVVRLLVGEFGADPNATTNNGETPLHLADARGNVQVVQYLHQLASSVYGQ